MLKDKYISNAENSKKPDLTKVVLSDDAFALCEFIELVETKIGKLMAALSR